MNTSPGIDLGYFLFEDLGSVDGAAGCWNACDQDLSATGFEDLLDPPPMGDLDGCDGGANGNRIETKEAVAEDYRVLGRAICDRGQ